MQKKEKKKMKGKTIIILSAMGLITILEVFALSKGINGVLLTSVIALLAGLAGWIAPVPKLLKTE